MVGQARLWVVLIIWMVSGMVSSHEDVCHIPNGCSPLAGLNKDAVRFNFTSLTSMASWETSSLQIADHWHQFSKMDCAAMLSLEMFVVTEFVNTSISLCSSLTGSGIACYESGQSSHRPSVMGEISKFGSCDVGWSSPQTWNNYTAIILSLPFLTYPKADSTTYECHWDPAATRINILNFTLAKIGCPLSYWGANCSIKCPSCENCHTFTGACLPEPDYPQGHQFHANRDASSLVALRKKHCQLPHHQPIYHEMTRPCPL
ncbi:uncharacterized protein LOC135475370 isoform X2 [Liolophura sinensis]|uniref:uncharacterized protein LOC135475370 isoform X2 n=1 Tax=Liolophura sinensis TaxID=3198878 RepID=UPI0031592564